MIACVKQQTARLAERGRGRAGLPGEPEPAGGSLREPAAHLAPRAAQGHGREGQRGSEPALTELMSSSRASLTLHFPPHSPRGATAGAALPR